MRSVMLIGVGEAYLTPLSSQELTLEASVPNNEMRTHTNVLNVPPLMNDH